MTQEAVASPVKSGDAASVGVLFQIPSLVELCCAVRPVAVDFVSHEQHFAYSDRWGRLTQDENCSSLAGALIFA